MNSIYIVFTSCNHSHVQVLLGLCKHNRFVFSHKPRLSCLRPSMCIYNVYNYSVTKSAMVFWTGSHETGCGLTPQFFLYIHQWTCRYLDFCTSNSNSMVIYI